MAEGRRHSVDVPLSRTLVALKRVRSLRDPDTNPVGRFATGVDNIKWEVDSWGRGGGGPGLELYGSSKHRVCQPRIHHLRVGMEDVGNRFESDGGSRVVRETRSRAVREARRERAARRSPDPTCVVPHSANCMDEEVDSCCGQTFELAERVGATSVKKKPGYGAWRKPSGEVENAMASRVGSPCMSVGDARTNPSSRSNYGLGTEEVDIVDSNFSGCGIGYCWSRTPTFGDPDLTSDGEDQEHPLLSAQGRESAYRDITPYPETPRSLSQKFRPKSFNDLVGLNVVAKSLLYAIFKGKVAPMYLFHGPRGTGKTSTARIFAAALNCLSLEEHRPCGFCRECTILFSGRSRDVKEMEAGKLNRRDRIKDLLKSASLAPYSSSFKIFIIDECQDLQGGTWDAIFSSLEEVSRHSIFVMITSDPDKLTRSCASHCQKYYFPKVKEPDIVSRLRKICVEEGLEFDNDALDFIAVKSIGSLRDAETTLDQLALLGKRITLPLAYELIGVVSDDELLDLLDLALSSDTANTVRRTRELLRSRIDPMQLTSQLADLIMDILAGRRQSEFLEAGRKFFQRHTLGEADLHKLRHALQVLSEAEKQLRTSKNQATWLTVALLQFSTYESSLIDVNGSKNFQRDNGVLSKASPRESLKNSVCYVCNSNRSNCLEKHCNRTKLETIWRRTIGNCRSSSLKRFLLREGSLSSIYANEGLVSAEIEFCRPDHVSRAEESWKLITDSLQHVLGCTVEIRIKLVPTSIRKDARVKKSSCSLLSCSGRKQEMSDSTMTDENENEASVIGETFEETSLSHCGKSFSPFIHQLDAKTMHHSISFDDEKVSITNNKDYVQSTGNSTPKNSVQGDLPKGCTLQSDFPKEEGDGCQNISIQEPDTQPSCFAKTAKLPRRFLSSDVARTICLRVQPHNKLDLSIPKKEAFQTYVCTYDPYTLCSRTNAQVTYSSGEKKMTKHAKPNFLCWRSPKSLTRKVF